MSQLLKIRVIGSGPTGSLMAYSLFKLGCKVTLFDLKTHDQLIKRSRAYAITHSSRRLFEKLDLWGELRQYMNPFNNLLIRDTVINSQTNFTINDISLENQRYNSIGWILDHSDLMKLILSKIIDETDIELRLGSILESQGDSYDLTIAAYGFNKNSSSKFNLRDINFKYKQGCLTSKVLLRGAKSTQAYEILRQEGPFAILPMGGDVFQIIWSAPINKCKNRISLNNSTLLDRITSIIPNGIQADSIIGEVNVFPNYFYISTSFYKKRSILIGESAHCFHPVGGQGLNLCWRDVYLLEKLIKLVATNKISLKHLPTLYFLLRILDVVSIGIITDLIVRTFSNRLLFTLPIRKIAFVLLNRSAIIRKQIFKIMTNGLSLRKLSK
tara:strand:- start:2955 stop:4106 length:1152 start_codon:yes stop_codon:yes gene_type:complete